MSETPDMELIHAMIALDLETHRELSIALIGLLHQEYGLDVARGLFAQAMEVVGRHRGVQT